jgi:transposase
MVARTHPRYPAEFKVEAVRLARTSGQPLRRTADELGVSIEALREWRKQGEVDAGEREGLTGEERVELARLRRENRVLRMERDLLKKAAAFFARESEPIS